MPWTSPSFDEYLAVMQSYGLGVTLTARPTHDWQADEISSGDVSFRWGQDGGGVAIEGAARLSSVALYTPLSNLDEQRGNGRSFDDDSLMLMPAGSEFCTAGAEWCRWICIDIADPALTARRHGEIIRVGAETRQTVTAAATRAIAAIEQTPPLAKGAAFAADALSDLREAARGAIEAADADVRLNTYGAHRISRTSLVEVVRRISKQCAGERTVLGDLAREAEVSTRTLQNAFHDYFGAPVQRFIHLRNLHEAHRQLVDADADETTVTTVAMNLGFWELGRFARQYRDVFGERPSDTLRRAPQ